MSAPPLKVTYLIALWGESYIRQFMDLSLRSLLAPHNIPAVAEAAASSFVFLTRKVDHKNFDTHPIFRRLSRYCDIKFITIDDLIFSGNYSATLTLAYERGMRHSDDMLGTYFIYLVADYVMADGSLANLLPHMRRGVSGITAGNFQVVEEDLLEMFKQKVDPATGVLAIKPRELMRLTLPHMHPLTIANTCTQSFSHTEHTNRLFWKVDDQTLVGRFFLRHMLCIKPEIPDYVIGASCDYAFIDEMCPSGNVVHVTDSDDYVVVELQPFSHEEDFIKDGPAKYPAMVRSLGRWLTASQRANIRIPVIFHAGELTHAAQSVVEQSGQAMEQLSRDLPVVSQPVRQHPYWISCLEGILEQLVALNNQGDYYLRGTFAGIVGSSVFEPPLGVCYGDYHLLKTARYRYCEPWQRWLVERAKKIAGVGGSHLPWHREYAHHRVISRAIHASATRSQYVYVVAFDTTHYADWCFKHYGNRVILQKADLFETRTVAELQAANPRATHAVIMMPVSYLHRLGQMLAKCALCLEGEKHVTVVVTQAYFSRGTKKMKERLAVLTAYYESDAVEVRSFTVITQPLRKWVDLFFQRHANKVLTSRWSLSGLIRCIPSFLCLAVAGLGYLVGSMLSRVQRYSDASDPTCAVIAMKLTGRTHIIPSSELRPRED